MKTKLLMAAAALSLIGASEASAATYVTYVLTGAYTANWNILASETPLSAPGVGIAFLDVPGTYPGSSLGYFADVNFYSTALGGGFQLFDQYGTLPDTPLLVGTGALGSQLYSGTEAAPTLLTGTFNLTDINGGAYTLTVGTAEIPAVPEPATWALMMAGFGALAIGLRSRKAKTKVTAAITFA